MSGSPSRGRRAMRGTRSTGRGETLTPVSFPDLALAVADLLPPRADGEE